MYIFKTGVKAKDFVLCGLFILTMIFMTVFTACDVIDPPGSDGNQDSNQGSSGAAKLSLLNYRDPDAPGAESVTETYNRFMVDNPGVILQVEMLYNEPYHHKLQTLAASDTLPDLFYIWPGARTGYVTKTGKAKDLTSLLGAKRDMFSPMAVTPQGPNGELWEIADTVTTCHVMYTNHKLLEDLGLSFPTSYAELLAQQPTIEAAGLMPVSMANKDGWEMQTCLLSTLTGRIGGNSWFDNAIVGDGAGYTDAPFIKALEIVKEMTDSGMFYSDINHMDYPQGTARFIAEEAVYYIDGDWKVGELQESLTDLQKTYITMEVFPDIAGQAGESGSTSAVPGTGLAMNSKLTGAQETLAWDFIWNWSGPVGSQIRYDYGQLPTYKLDIDTSSLDPIRQKQYKHLTESPATYVLDNVHDPEAFDTLHTDLQEMMFGNLTPSQVAQKWENWLEANDSKRGNISVPDSNNPGTDNPVIDNPDTGISLSVLNYQDPSAPGAAKSIHTYNQFLEANPGVILEVEELFDEPYHQKLQALAASDTLPDLFYIWPGARSGFVTSTGKAKDLSGLLGAKKDMFSPMAVAPQGPNGELWEIADTVTTCHVMYTNRKLLQDLGLSFPTSYAELLAQQPTIEVAGLIPVSMANKDGWEMQTCVLSTLVGRIGGNSWFDNAIVGNGAGYTDAPFIKALEIVKEMTDSGMFYSDINQMDYPQGTARFIAEEAVYYIDGDWKAGELQEKLTDLQKSYITMEVFPDIAGQAGESGNTAAVPGTGFAMNSKLTGAQETLAWDFIWNWSGPVGSQIRYDYGRLPTYKLDIDMTDQDPMLQELYKHQTESPATYVLDNKHDNEAFDTLHTDLQEMMFGNLTPSQVAQKWENWLEANDSKRGN